MEKFGIDSCKLSAGVMDEKGVKSWEEGAKGGVSLFILFTSMGFPGGSEKYLPNVGYLGSNPRSGKIPG